MEQLLKLLNDKINEAENCEEKDISEEFLKGYIAGIEHAKICIKEFEDLFKGEK